MARHKKKKSPPTDSNEDTNENKEPEENTSPIRSNEPIKESDYNEKESKLNKLFWMRVGFAVMGGIAATFLFESITGEERRWASIGFMIILFIVTAVIAKGMRIPLPASDRKKIVTQGIGSYIFIYLFIWILSYTVVHAGNTSSVIQSPLP